MAQRADTLDLARLRLAAGEARRLELDVPVDAFEFSGQRYEPDPVRVPARLDVTRMSGAGHSLRLRFGADLRGPCMRCLEPASPRIEVDSREVEREGAGEGLESPYVEDGVLDLRAWARDSLALALPQQILCRPDCAGLCAVCGADLNADPGHRHEREPDPRWAALRGLRIE